jgi:glycerol kinase
MSANDWMAQDIADLLDLSVERPELVETTALGAAMLAGLGAGLFASLEDAAAAMRSPSRRFEPAMPEDVRQERLTRWAKALASV